jgi:hypothetical protein
MGAFTDEEVAYMSGERRLARIATVGADCTPHVVPVGWSYNLEGDDQDARCRTEAGRRQQREPRDPSHDPAVVKASH